MRAQAFVDKWRPRIEAMPNARHRSLLRVDHRRDARTQAVLRTGARRPHRSARPPRRWRRHRRRRARHPVDRTVRASGCHRHRQQPRRPPRGAVAFAVERLALAHRRPDGFATDRNRAGRGGARGPAPLSQCRCGGPNRPSPRATSWTLSSPSSSAFGRERPFPDAPRTLDLDLILLGASVLDNPGLHVPHPRFRERFFVLGPLAEVAPDMIDPVTGLRAWELLRKLLADEAR